MTSGTSFSNGVHEMTRRRRWDARVLAVLLAVVIGTSVWGFQHADRDYFFRISKSIEIFGRVYREVALNYVDEIDPERLMESGIDGLLGGLDPYTNFIGEKEGDEVELITTGKYGGIGVSVGVRDGFITILSLMDGYSAQRQGLQPGDRIIAVDGRPTVSSRPDDVRNMTRGEPGTEVRVRIDRDGEPQPLEFVLMREEIQLKSVTYADFLGQGTAGGSGIAYIRLERFTRGAGDELYRAIKDLKGRGAVTGVVLDLRDNPGGLLDVAVDVVEKFVRKGALVVSTRGRNQETEKKFFAMEEPLLGDVPLVVLINRASASASEIVAGAVQDLDRGIIVGTRSFGKGLVQTIAPLPYSTQLKITTAKYYTPSGRCIQEVDYMHKGKDGVFAVTPESLRQQFKTQAGRIEYASGGITPDSVVAAPEPSALQKELLRKAMYFKFASRHIASRRNRRDLPPGDTLLAEFRRYLEEQNFTYKDEAETKLEEIRQAAARYPERVRGAIGDLQAMLAGEHAQAVERHRGEVLRSLRMEIMGRIAGDRGRIEAAFADDGEIRAAVGLLNDRPSYDRRLKGG